MKILQIVLASFFIVSLSASQKNPKKNNSVLPYPDHGAEQLMEIICSYKKESQKDDLVSLPEKKSIVPIKKNKN